VKSVLPSGTFPDLPYPPDSTDARTCHAVLMASADSVEPV
jgi:hypothetical protein